ncbi:hypothetical protein CAPTEDRAFT_190856, partial [Capitella teleta]
TEKYYLRSLGEGDVRKNRADISQDFPVLSRDITIPPFFDKQKFFSSVFRISSRKIQLWTHYDVMDNILIVVSGRKRVVLYPPSDALFLYLAVFYCVSLIVTAIYSPMKCNITYISALKGWGTKF